ncbi:hypothetical protein GH714_002066 [Hevea brasiliensis]|uniref:Fibronectin type III-like domain-containing protein n=1 Tax=Hevea brasiliensis TaxID=3981 RepID=A0A6A6LB11_HEVBR|nr:hypothetical protein GH714_002066 [Hevea brasiliensis]
MNEKMKLIILIVTVFINITSLVHLVESVSPPFACDLSNPSTKLYPFCSNTLSISQRVQDLISRLTLDEKIAQLVNTAPPIPRLGIPSYQWWDEALHGVAYVGNTTYGINFNGTIRSATSFPQVILTAASFNPQIWFRIGQVIGKEARALYNAGQATGLTFWAPNINIFRDPRWGRGQETPGEDPLVTGKYAMLFVRGVQGDSFEGGKLGEHLQASACCKHFTAYDLDNWKGVNRFVFDAHVTLQDLADTFQPPFHSCIEEGKASGIMCAYNLVNGVPNCADYNLLSKTARGKWGFQGYIVSDCDSVALLHDEQGYAKSPEDAIADVLKAGMDVDCGNYMLNHTKSAIKQKKLAESEIDRALGNLFSVRMRLGLFNGNPLKLPYGNIGPDQVCSKEHQDLALEAAREGIVLLKNSVKLLPLGKSKTRSLAVIGHNADEPHTLLGNYEGPPCNIVTPLQALHSYVKNVRHHRGCGTAGCTSASIDKAVKIAKLVDYVVLIMGLDQTQEREGLDRLDLVLPGKQQELITEVAKAAKKPVVLVILSGGGRLPVTWYPQDFTKVPMTDMRMRPEPSSGYPGRSYRFYEGKKVFEFGYGLSYSNYSYKFISVAKNNIYFYKRKSNPNSYILVSELGTKLCEKSKFWVTIGVENIGTMAGKHPVLFFVKQAKLGNGKALKQLVAFQSVKLNAKEKAEIKYELNPCEHLSTANEDGSMVIDDGLYYLIVGSEEYPISVIVV